MTIYAQFYYSGLLIVFCLFTVYEESKFFWHKKGYSFETLSWCCVLLYEWNLWYGTSLIPSGELSYTIRTVLAVSLAQIIFPYLEFSKNVSLNDNEYSKSHVFNKHDSFRRLTIEFFTEIKRFFNQSGKFFQFC